MKKTTVKVTVILLVLVVIAVGVYAFLTDRAKTAAGEAALTPVQKVLCRDLSIDYPGTPREVIRYYTEIEKCFYSDSTTDEELEQLGLQARGLYDAEFLAHNGSEEDYLIQLKTDVEQFARDKRVITGVSVASSVNVDVFEEDGFEFARVNCDYSVMDGGVPKSVSKVYLLRKDENRLWKIYGWENADQVTIED